MKPDVPAAFVDGRRGSDRWNCRAETYVIEQDMSAEGSEAFGTEMGSRLADDLEAGGDKDVGDLLDEMGVPAYEDQCGEP